jgi:hypothetical protein
MVTEDEGDEGANGSSSGDRQGGDRQNRVGEDGEHGNRQSDESERNSRATRRERLGGGGRAESRSSDVETGWFLANGSSIAALAGEALNLTIWLLPVPRAQVTRAFQFS